MSKYKIAVMPGDGVGKDVTEAAMLVLEKIGLDAKYTYADVGWEFWCKEGNPLPDRTIEVQGYGLIIIYIKNIVYMELNSTKYLTKNVLT